MLACYNSLTGWPALLFPSLFDHFNVLACYNWVSTAPSSSVPHFPVVVVELPDPTQLWKVKKWKWKEKQSKAKQSKAKQSKAKQIPTKRTLWKVKVKSEKNIKADPYRELSYEKWKWKRESENVKVKRTAKQIPTKRTVRPAQLGQSASAERLARNNQGT